MTFSSRSATKPWLWALALAASILSTVPAKTATAQDTTIYIRLSDLCARPCDTIRIPVSIINLVHEMAAYQLTYALSRPGLVFFDPTILFETAGSATENWEFSSATTAGGTSIRATGMADLPVPPGITPGITPSAVPQRLVFLIARVPCDPDTISGNIVRLESALPQGFTDPQGTTIEPASVAGNTITVVTTALGDMDESGYYDIVDVVRSVNCAFRGDCPGCALRVADVTCDQIVNLQDVVRLIDAVFRGGSAPACP
jgi:hypothetical protein